MKKQLQNIFLFLLILSHVTAALSASSQTKALELITKIEELQSFDDEQSQQLYCQLTPSLSPEEQNKNWETFKGICETVETTGVKKISKPASHQSQNKAAKDLNELFIKDPNIIKNDPVFIAFENHDNDLFGQLRYAYHDFLPTDDPMLTRVKNILHGNLEAKKIISLEKIVAYNLRTQFPTNPEGTDLDASKAFRAMAFPTDSKQEQARRILDLFEMHDKAVSCTQKNLQRLDKATQTKTKYTPCSGCTEWHALWTNLAAPDKNEPGHFTHLLQKEIYDQYHRPDGSLSKEIATKVGISEGTAQRLKIDFEQKETELAEVKTEYARQQIFTKNISPSEQVDLLRSMRRRINQPAIPIYNPELATAA